MRKLKNVELKENESLYIGYFDQKGNEMAKFNCIQKMTKQGFEHIKEYHPEKEVERVSDGYATLFAEKYV